GPCDRFRGSFLAPNLCFLFVLLSPDAAASFLGQGRAGASANPAPGAGTRGSHSPSWRTAPPLRTTRRLGGSESVQLATRSLGESTRVPSPADWRLPSAPRSRTGFL